MAFESVKKIAEADFPTRWGAFRILGFEGRPAEPLVCNEAGKAGGDKAEVEGLVALVMGDIHSTPPLVRIHSQCLTGDVFGSLRCDCRLQLEMALKQIGEAGAGILLYEQQEGRGIGLMAKLKAYELQDQGRDYGGSQRGAWLRRRLPRVRVAGRSAEAAGREECAADDQQPGEGGGDGVGWDCGCGASLREVEPQESFAGYLKTKQEKMGHIVEMVVTEDQGSNAASSF